MELYEFKKQFNQNSPYIHLNNAGQAPIPDCNRHKVIEWLNRFYTEAAFCSMEGWALVDVTRTLLAEFTGAAIEEVAFFQTTASALSQAALSIPLKAGDKILTWDQEYPSNFYPWRMAAEKSGAEIVQIKSLNFKTDVDSILKHVDDRTKVIAVSWIQYMTGAETGLRGLSEALKDRDIWLVADVIQGVGVRPFNFHDSGFDIVCGGSHKWMCSSYGGGYMLVKAGRLKQIQPREVGAMTYGFPETEKSFLIKPKESAIKFEPGSKAMIEIIAMAESIRLFQSVGINIIHKEACRLSTKLRDGLIELGLTTYFPDEGPIVNFTAGAEIKNHNITAALKKNLISYAARGPGIRLSVHAYNTDIEIEKTLKVIKGAIEA